MRKKNFKGRCEKRHVLKCEDVCRTYDDIQRAYLDKLEANKNIKSIESWSNEGGDNAWRAERQEQYYHYIVDEVIPLMRERNDALPVVTGLSMGATHAAIVFLRRPDLFRGIVALSGVYDSD